MFQKVILYEVITSEFLIKINPEVVDIHNNKKLLIHKSHE